MKMIERKRTTILTLAASLLLMATPLWTACGDDDPEDAPEEQEQEQPDSPDTPETPDDPTEPVTPTTYAAPFTVGGAEATTTHPAVATAGAPVALTLSMEVKHTDADGKTYERTPKAVVQMQVKQDEVVCNSLSDLMALTQHVTTTTGTDPAVHQTAQQFAIGPQTVIFDLSHEVFSIVNAAGKTVTLPYIQLNQARNGTLKPTEQTRAGNGRLRLTGISLTPLDTRGTYTTDQHYEVVAGFTILAQTASIDATPQQQTLVLEARYNAVVRTVTDYPDPTTTFAYDLVAQYGTPQTRSPFTLFGKRMKLQWQQSADYTWFSLEKMRTQVERREPMADACLTISADTLWLQDVDELEKVVAGTAQLTEKDNGDARTHSGSKTFTAGDQVVSIDWNYDAPKDVKMEGNTVSFPYLMLSEPQLVSIQATEVPNAQIAGRKANVYNVTMRLKQEVTGVNTSEAISEPVEYIVKYTAVIGYPESTLNFTYKRDILGGTKSTASPFFYSYGDTLSLRWTEKTNYEYFSLSNRNMKKLSYETTANVNLTASLDTLWLQDADELEKVVAGKAEMSEKDDGNARLCSGKKTFTSGDQVVNINWNYSALKDAEIEGNEVSFPYLTLSEPQLVNIQATQWLYAQIPGKNAKVYYVTMRLKQELNGVNTPKEVSETLEYVVNYVAVVLLPDPPKLLEVKYRKGFIWHEPQYNLHLRNQYILYRDSVFSNGETRTGASYSGACAVEHLVRSGPPFDNNIVDSLWSYSGVNFMFHAMKREVDEAYRTPFIVYTKTGVPDLSKISTGIDTDKYSHGEAGTNLDKYINMSEGGYFNPNNPQNGWYFRDIEYNHLAALLYEVPDRNEPLPIRMYQLFLRWYDRFTYADGKMFDFLDYAATLDFDLRVEDITMDDGLPAKVITHEGIIHWLGKDFYSATVDTVYQLPADMSTLSKNKKPYIK